MVQKIARQMTRQMTMCSSDRPTNTARPTRPPTTKKQRQQRQRIKKTTTTNNTNEWPGNLQCAVCGNNENSSEIAGF
jgi:hypothetical protein